MLSTFQGKIVKKVDELGSNNDDAHSKIHFWDRNSFGGTGYSWRQFYCSGAYRRVPDDWVFPNVHQVYDWWMQRDWFLCR